MSSNRLRILMVEDVATDAELVAKELERASIDCEIRRVVDTAVDYRQELEAFRPQMILSDLSMPRFDGMEALAIARREQDLRESEKRYRVLFQSNPRPTMSDSTASKPGSW